MPAPKLLIIGLDCMEPSLVFEQWRSDLPNLSRLMAQGCYGRLESSIPAITVPAWSCMMSGRDPGELGIYGFRNRANRGYGNFAISDGRAVKQPRLWDILGEAGWSVAVISVPGTSPPYPVNGALVSCFLTPNPTVPYSHPPELAQQIQTWLPDFMLDVSEFRSDEKDRILSNIYRLCDQRFTLAAKLLEQNQPDFLMLVDMGVDRIHHAFWKAMDTRHPQHQSDSPYATAIHDYYCHVDRRVGELLAQCGEAAVLVVSDHGARPLMGGICINQWLIDAGYLVLKKSPASPTPLDQLEIDWSQTQAWGAGGYYGRVFLNVQGREPAGIVPLRDYEVLRDRLSQQLAAIPDPQGQPLNTQVFKPQQIYQKVRGIAPDLLVYFDELAWRSIGTVGNGELHTTDNDTGADDANHARYGLMIFHDPQAPGSGQVIQDAQIYDILPSLLARYGLTPSPSLRGKLLPI
ncbi:MAG: alkaline phosphatase family protein [Pegethrix bostrychoides GSE-TBD4-15B]|jgi:predicted AlkP superfamily phosphohydrolase/phosphomutase|uniref:Alkaline phosphatase family protein n=1 Tax=Pegethrix bostrychoides GSE-TBD4-15B TaxID=2839662 RepID=A0A951PBN1_9CYAN|nr:alkaline phosphatase family protein [Pegethrix bostrychoides GSE-TBD4-15B]